MNGYYCVLLENANSTVNDTITTVDGLEITIGLCNEGMGLRLSLGLLLVGILGYIH